jgi:hypothetical protein
LVDWHELKAIAAWTPINALPVQSAHLEGVLFRLAPTQYVICPPYNEHLLRVPGVVGFLGALLWAPHDGAARRAALLDIEADDAIRRLEIEPVPPADLLLPGGPTSYGAILSELKTGRYGKPFESASYRVAKDGAFVHRSISVGGHEFFFRNRKDDDNDTCYAIQFRPTGFRKAAEYAQSAAKQRDGN